MLESEFFFRWVSLDMRATSLLLDPTNDVAFDQDLMRFVQRRMSIAESPQEITSELQRAKELDARMAALNIEPQTLAQQLQEFQKMGGRRYTLYEPKLKQRFGSFGTGSLAFTLLRPDVILTDYQPCILSALDTHATDDQIAQALKRVGHLIEFTSFLHEDLHGLEDYLVNKIEVYATMLENA
jgi:hypothetical protein